MEDSRIKYSAIELIIENIEGFKLGWSSDGTQYILDENGVIMACRVKKYRNKLIKGDDGSTYSVDGNCSKLEVLDSYKGRKLKLEYRVDYSKLFSVTAQKTTGADVETSQRHVYDLDYLLISMLEVGDSIFKLRELIESTDIRMVSNRKLKPFNFKTHLMTPGRVYIDSLNELTVDIDCAMGVTNKFINEYKYEIEESLKEFVASRRKMIGTDIDVKQFIINSVQYFSKCGVLQVVLVRK